MRKKEREEEVSYILREKLKYLTSVVGEDEIEFYRAMRGMREQNLRIKHKDNFYIKI